MSERNAPTPIINSHCSTQIVSPFFNVSIFILPDEAEQATSPAFQAYLHIEAPSSPVAIKDAASIMACLAPQDQHVDSTYQALENVLLHHYFGINHFWVYDNGITSKFTQALSQPDIKLSNMQLSILPWNLPVQLGKEQVDYLVENDCYYRAKALGFSTHFVVSLSQILVPKSGSSHVKKALQDSKKTGQLLVDVLKFCSEYPEDHGTLAKSQKILNIASLQQVVFNKDLSAGLHVKVLHQSGDQRKISRDELAVHDYAPCHDYDLDVNGAEAVRDKTVARQAKDIEEFLGQFFPKKAVV